MQDFKKLAVWKKGFDVAKLTFRSTEQFPKSEEFGLKSQMRRAAVSLPSNIAEGTGRDSQKELYRFLTFSCGSSYELETQLLLALELGFMESQSGETMLSELNQYQRMLIALMKKVKQNINPTS